MADNRYRYISADQFLLPVSLDSPIVERFRNKLYEFGPAMSTLLISIFGTIEMNMEIYNKLVPLFNEYFINNLNEVRYFPDLSRNFYDMWIGIIDEIYDMYHPLGEQIENLYAKKGFVSHYFIFVNKDDPRVKAVRGEIPLTKETFEWAAFSYIPPEYGMDYIKNIQLYLEDGTAQNRNKRLGLEVNAFHTIRDYISLSNKKRTTNMHKTMDEIKFLGWSKWNLFLAIKHSGLMIDHRQPYRAPRLPYDAVKILPASAIGVDKEKVVSGFGRNSYLPKAYYEVIYRQIFDTNSQIDWVSACQHNLVSLNMLRYVIVTVFGQDYKDIKDLNMDKLCQKVAEIAEARRELASSTAQLAQELRDPLTLQPGGLLHRPAFLTEGMIRDLPSTEIGPIVEIGPPKKRDPYREVITACADPDISKHYLLFIATRMGLLDYSTGRLGGLNVIDMKRITKEDICLTIKNFIDLLIRARRPLPQQ